MSPETTPANVLLVDDLQENLTALEALIRAPGRQIFCARSGDEALSLMLEHDFALAILDVQMPAMNGFELAELMRGTERTRTIPIVFVSAAGHELNYAFRGYESGAVDFLHKPLDPHAVRSKVKVFVDLCRQRQELVEAQGDLERAVAMRDNFMSMVSHELRNPLNSVYLQAQLRRKLLSAPGAVDREAMLKLLERDENQIRGMIRLLDDMLDVSRLRTGKLAVTRGPADLVDIARRVVEAMDEQARTRGTSVSLQAPDTLPLTADAFRIEQVLNNLLTNALRSGAGKPVDVVVRREGEYGVVSVRDQGIGIAEADRERIFEQFERAESTQEIPGLGLGLYISRQIVRAHQGSIEVASRPGQGSEFTVRLPL